MGVSVAEGVAVGVTFNVADGVLILLAEAEVGVTVGVTETSGSLLAMEL